MKNKINLPGFTTDSKYSAGKEDPLETLNPQAQKESEILMQRFRRLNESTGDVACGAACTCCRLPSPIQPECCGVCLACGICELTGWCAFSSPLSIEQNYFV